MIAVIFLIDLTVLYSIENDDDMIFSAFLTCATFCGGNIGGRAESFRLQLF